MPNSFIDLHTHSAFSDGSYTPTAIVDAAREIGLRTVALTDHDTVAGIGEFLEHASKFDDVEAVPGVEISVMLYGAEVHIVGLFVDHNCDSLNELLSEIRGNRDNRNLIIIKKLNGMGYDITIDEVRDLAGGESVGRPHFAKILIDKGYFTHTQEVFDHCLKRGTPAYVSRELPSPEKAIGEIHNAGGLTFWAHPVHRRKNERSHVKKTLKYLKDLDLDGVECYYTTFTPHQQEMLLEFANEFEILESGGTDFHGDNHPDIKLGFGYGDLRVPESVYEKILQARHR